VSGYLGQQLPGVWLLVTGAGWCLATWDRSWLVSGYLGQEQAAVWLLGTGGLVSGCLGQDRAGVWLPGTGAGWCLATWDRSGPASDSLGQERPGV
jgi:hypothetical protein